MPSLGLGLGLVLELKVGRNYMLSRSFFMLPSYKLTSFGSESIFEFDSKKSGGINEAELDHAMIITTTITCNS